MGHAVVIPAYNDEAVVSNAIASAVDQTGIDEVIVVDDGSSDRTFETARATDGPVRCFSQANAGPGAARNTGAKSTCADHLVFLDADDEMLVGALDRFARAHAKGAVLVRAASQTRGPDGSPLITEPLRSVHPFPRGTPLAGSFSVNAAVFHGIGGYDGVLRYGENSELLMRISALLGPESNRIAFLSEPTVEVRRRAGRASTHYDDVRLAAVDRMLNAHGDTLQADPESLRAHLLIASMLHRRQGQRREAVMQAYRAARVGPPNARAVFRVCRAAMTPVPSRDYA